MEHRDIVITRRAELQFDNISQWYLDHVGTLAQKHLLENTGKALKALAFMPTIGRKDERRSAKGKEYMQFVSHPRLKIIYRYDEHSLYIVAFVVTKKISKCHAQNMYNDK